MIADDLADCLDMRVIYGLPLKEAATMLRKQQAEIEYWKSAFERSMTLYDQVKHLEAQVYGGTTK